MTQAEFERTIGAIKVDVYHGTRLVCRQSTLADCYPGEFEAQCAAACCITNGRPYVTRQATLRAAAIGE